MLAYSAMASYALLYSSYNEIDIYVEDKTLVGMYERIFKRIFAERYRFETIIPFGNKNSIKAEHVKQINDRSRRRLFVVDGDFDWIHTDLSTGDLYELKMYSVENFIFDDEALLSFAGECSPSKSVKDVISTLNIAQIDENLIKLQPLMLVYAVARALNSRQITVNYSLERLKTLSSDNIDVQKVRFRCLKLYRLLCKEFSTEIVRDFRSVIKSEIEGKDNVHRRLIAGKHYGLRLIMGRLRRDFGFSGKAEHLLSALIERSPLNTDPDFIDAMSRI